MNVNVHKIINGDGAEKYLPMALSKVRWLMETFPHNMAQVFMVEDTTIRVSTDVLSGQCFVRIDGGGAQAYEFVIPDKSLSEYFKGKSVRVALKDDGFEYKLLGSNSSEYAPPQGKTTITDPDPAVCAALLENTLSLKALQVNGHQLHSFSVDGLDVYSVWRQSYPLYHWAYNGTQAHDNVGGQDIKYDMPLTVLPQGKAVESRGKNSYTPDTDWYRSSTVRKVSANGKEHLFGIEIDYFGTVHAFPLDQPTDNKLWQDSPYADQQIKTNLAVSKQMRIPFPNWCLAPAFEGRMNVVGSTAGTSQHVPGQISYQWEFNSTGTRAAAVVLQQDTSPTENVVNAMTYRVMETNINNFGEEHRASAFGLLEISITVGVSGPEVEDFTLDVALTYSSQPFQDERWFVRAAYASRFIDPSAGVAKDTLLSMELELLGELRDDPDDDTPLPSPVGRYVVKEAVSQTEILSFPFAGYRAQESEWMGARIVSCDLPTLSFIVEARAFVAGDAATFTGLFAAGDNYFTREACEPRFPVDGGLHVRVIVRGARRTDLEIDRGPHAELAASLLDQPVSPTSFRMPCGFVYSEGENGSGRNYLNQWESFYFWGELRYLFYMLGAFGRAANDHTNYTTPQTSSPTTYSAGWVCGYRKYIDHEFFNPRAFSERCTEGNTTFRQYNSINIAKSARVMCDSYRFVMLDTFAVDPSQKFLITGDRFFSVCAGPFVWYDGSHMKHAIGGGEPPFRGGSTFELGEVRDGTSDLGPGWEHLSWQEWWMVEGSVITAQDLTLDPASFETLWIDTIEYENAKGVVHTTSHLEAHKKTGGIEDTHTAFAGLSWGVEKTYFHRSYFLEGASNTPTGFLLEVQARTEGRTPDVGFGTCGFVVHDSGYMRLAESGPDHGTFYNWDYGARMTPHAVSAFSNVLGLTYASQAQWQANLGVPQTEVLLNIVPHLKAGATTIGKFERKK